MAKKVSKISLVLVCVIALLVGAILGFGAITYINLPLTEELEYSGETFYTKSSTTLNSSVTLSGADDEISIHFLELGNKYTGDCTYIKAGGVDILIDCGSKASSISTVSSYLDNYVTDGVLEYVIITHAHQDHYAGFATSSSVQSIFDKYTCKNIITFSMTNQDASNGDTLQYQNFVDALNSSSGTSIYQTYKSNKSMYNNFLRELEETKDNGSNVCTVQDCMEGKNLIDGEDGETISFTEDISLTFLNSKYYTTDSSTENNYSVCLTFNYDENYYLFTGDLEEDGETYLGSNNTFIGTCLVYKAGHHGSKTSSSADFMNIVKPQNVCVCCCAGSSEYTDTKNNQFPTQDFINNVAVHTANIYVTTLCTDYDNSKFESFNGNIVCITNARGFNIICSNNNTILKETEWFKNNRTWPTDGK